MRYTHIYIYIRYIYIYINVNTEKKPGIGMDGPSLLHPVTIAPEWKGGVLVRFSTRLGRSERFNETKRFARNFVASWWKFLFWCPKFPWAFFRNFRCSVFFLKQLSTRISTFLISWPLFLDEGLLSCSISAIETSHFWMPGFSRMMDQWTRDFPQQNRQQGVFVGDLKGWWNTIIHMVKL